MHGMLSLGVLVAAFTIFAGWAAFLAARLYRTCPLPQQKADEEEQLQNEPETVA